jgi:hypothetical protein
MNPILKVTICIIFIYTTYATIAIAENYEDCVNSCNLNYEEEEEVRSSHVLESYHSCQAIPAFPDSSAYKECTYKATTENIEQILENRHIKENCIKAC